MYLLFTSFKAVPAIPARKRPVMLVVLLLLVSAGVGASPAALPLNEALRLAASASAAAQATQATVAASQHAAVRAGQLPDPTLKLGIDNLPVSGPDKFRPNADFMTMRRIGIEQQWVSKDKRQVRSERARRAVEADQAAHLETVAGVRMETGKAWLTVLYLQRALALTREIAHEMESDLAAVQSAHRGAKASASDVLQAKAELILGQDAIQGAEQDLRTALVNLRRWTRTDIAAVADAAPELSTHAPGIPVAELERYHPKVLNARRAMRLADADANAAVHESRPDWAFELGFAQRGSQFSNMVSVGVSIPLTVNRAQRQDREIAEKTELGTRARLRYDDALTETQSAIEAQSTQLDSLKRRIDRLDAELLPAAALLVETSLADYRGGIGTLTAVFKARRTALERRLQVNALQLEAALVWASLELHLIAPDGATNERAGQ
jgi:outer membrane protein TolC